MISELRAAIIRGKLTDTQWISQILRITIQIASLNGNFLVTETQNKAKSRLPNLFCFLVLGLQAPATSCIMNLRQTDREKMHN